jgi:hypothetical protein
MAIEHEDRSMRDRGADFFTVEAVTLAPLVRFHVYFVIDVASRKVQIADRNGLHHPR